MGGGAVPAAVGGVAATISSNVPTLPSSSSSSSSLSNSRLPFSGNYSASFRRHCLCPGGVCRCEYAGVRGNGAFINRVFGPIPSRFEVETAIAALQSFLHRISSSGSESDQRIMETQRYRRIYEAFRLLQTDSNVQRMVMSISSDKAVWDAILNNKMVRKLLEPPPPRPPPPSDEDESPQSSSVEPDLGALILRWILEITKAKIMELVEKFQSLVNEVFQSSRGEGSNPEITEQLDESIVSSTFLAIVILLIVVFARAQRA